GGEVSIQLVELASGKVRRQVHRSPRSQPVSALTFSRDGKLLATGMGDGTILIWDVCDPVLDKQPADHLSADELQEFWSELAVNDAGRGYQAIRRLVASPTQAVALFKKHLHPVEAKDIDEKEIAEFVAQLNDDDFAVREAASRELRRLGEKARPALVKALGNKPSPEVRRRAEQLLEKLGDPDPPWEMLRPLRALE